MTTIDRETLALVTGGDGAAAAATTPSPCQTFQFRIGGPGNLMTIMISFCSPGAPASDGAATATATPSPDSAAQPDGAEQPEE